MRGGVARGETARWRRREDAFHTGPSTRAGRFETRAKRTTTGAQSEDPSESSLGTPRRVRACRLSDVTTRPVLRFVPSETFPSCVQPPGRFPGETLPSTTSSTLRRRVTSQTKLLHPRARLAPRRASGSRLAHPRLVLRGHLISEVSSPQSSRLPRVQQRPVRFPSLRRVLHGHARLRAQCLAVPARESRVDWAGSVRASDGRGAGRGGRRGEARAGAAGDLERASCSCPCTPRWPPIGPRTSRARRIGSNA